MKIKFKGKEMEIPEGATFKVVGGDLVVSPGDTEFKDGDICYSNNGCVKIIFIYKKVLSGNSIYCYSSLNSLNHLDKETDWINSNGNLRLATEEEKQKLFYALEKSGKRWNPETKQIEDILKVGDICIFWDDEKFKASINTLTHIDESDSPYRSNDGRWFNNAIKCTSLEQYQNFISEV